jgi:hypothetical protein
MKRVWLDAGAGTLMVLFTAIGVQPGIIPEEPDKPGDLSPRPSPAPGWGEVVAGISVRLEANKTVWEKGETPGFKIGVRNLGDKVPAISFTQNSLGILEVDHDEYLLDQEGSSGHGLAPGERRDNIPVTLNGKWFTKLRRPLLLSPGKHTVRFALIPGFWFGKRGGDEDKSIPSQTRIYSNPVEIEIHSTQAEYETALRAAAGPDQVPRDGPAIANLYGSVVDEETGELVPDFWIQAGSADPKDASEVTWISMHTGPDLRNPGHFGVQGWSRWTTWRVFAAGYLPEQVVEPPLFPSTRPITDLVVRLKRGAELTGRVLDYQGRPVTGASVFLVTDQKLSLTDGVPERPFRGSTYTTGDTGRFALRGISGEEQKVVIFLADGLEAAFTSKVEPGQEWNLALPQPAALDLHYDIPKDQPEAEFQLQRMAMEPEYWGSFGLVLKPTVANPGQLLLTNLTPGEYDFGRPKTLRVGRTGRGVLCDRQRLLLKSGETQRVDVVRSAGFPVRGEVTGLDQSEAQGGFLYVRSADATSEPDGLSEWGLPCFDARTFGQDGHFETARLVPGNYALRAEVYEPEPPSSVWRSGVRLPSYIGIAKITVTADTAPAPVKVQLRAR